MTKEPSSEGSSPLPPNLEEVHRSEVLFQLMGDYVENETIAKAAEEFLDDLLKAIEQKRGKDASARRKLKSRETLMFCMPEDTHRTYQLEYFAGLDSDLINRWELGVYGDPFSGGKPENIRLMKKYLAEQREIFEEKKRNEPRRGKIPVAILRRTRDQYGGLIGW